MRNQTDEDKKNIIEEKRNLIFEIYKNREVIEEILKELDCKWKKGEVILDELDRILNRDESIRIFFEYLIQKDIEEVKSKEKNIDLKDNNFPEILDLPNGEEIKDFLDGLANKYDKLAKPFREYILGKRGIVNHLSKISVDGIHYNLETENVQAGFSLYTFDKKVFQTRDDVDDFIWLAQGIIEIINQALECCDRDKSLSEDYRRTLTQRFTSMNSAYRKLETSIEKLNCSSDSTDKENSYIPEEDELEE